ncbi:16S rRNA (cytidine(1402)-2'-O)-methyltransferase [Advenella incenata]
MTSESGQFDARWQRVLHDLANQDWPAGCLYVVATPIGNLADLSPRALYALQKADLIAAEDTRSSRVLLNAWGIETPMMAAHRHNEAQAAATLLRHLGQGQRVALISDAGAPAVSDPGGRIVSEVRAAGHQVRVIPGPSAVIAALMGSGATSDENPAFVFAGFAPQKAVARQTWLKTWCAVPAAIILFESPHRVRSTAIDIAAIAGADRPVTVARELTKRFEQIATVPAGELADWFAQDSQRTMGEFVLIVHEAAKKEAAALGQDAEQIVTAMLRSYSVKDTARLLAAFSGLPRDVLYAKALQIKQQDNEAQD